MTVAIEGSCIVSGLNLDEIDALHVMFDRNPEIKYAVRGRNLDFKFYACPDGHDRYSFTLCVLTVEGDVHPYHGITKLAPNDQWSIAIGRMIAMQRAVRGLGQ